MRPSSSNMGLVPLTAASVFSFAKAGLKDQGRDAFSLPSFSSAGFSPSMMDANLLRPAQLTREDLFSVIPFALQTFQTARKMCFGWDWGG